MDLTKDQGLLLGAIFAESSSKNWGGGENSEEKILIGLCIINMAYYGAMKKEQVGDARPKKCYNTTFGGGDVLTAIKNGILAYNTKPWNLIMNGDSLKSEQDIAKLKDDDKAHYNLSKLALEMLVANYNARPAIYTPLSPVPPLQFNKASNNPPSKRMQFLGSKGAHSFYGFVDGRQCQ